MQQPTTTQKKIATTDKAIATTTDSTIGITNHNTIVITTTGIIATTIYNSKKDRITESGNNNTNKTLAFAATTINNINTNKTLPADQRLVLE